MKRTLYMITGPKGSGKSTLAKHIYGNVIEQEEIQCKYSSLKPSDAIEFLIEQTKGDYKNIIFVTQDKKLIPVIKDIADSNGLYFVILKLENPEIKKPEAATSGSNQ